MIRPLVPHSWFVTERRDSLRGAALAAVSLDWAGRQSHVVQNEAAALVCALDGEFYNARELAQSLPTAVRQDLGAKAVRRGAFARRLAARGAGVFEAD